MAGQGAFHLWPRGRRSTTRNFERVLPEVSQGKRRRIAQRSIANYGRYLVDFARFPREGELDVEDPDGHVDRLKELLDEGQGAIVATMHFGNWDAAAASLGRAGIPVTAVADRFGDAKLDRAVFGAREAAGLDIAVRGEPGKIVRALKNGRVLAMVVDRPTPGEGVPVRFFGEECEVPDGAARLALRTGAPVIPAACYRLRPGAPEFRIWADWDVVLPEARGSDGVQALTQAIFSAHERVIRQWPSQWYMFREMWPERKGARP
ncbi:MAG: lysophospholipid acyltransferase family protein [Dehalococcoidia bacterium]|nr:lysophospholipid acyltransferase family protein [Dehalococcoidia bacterium]